MIVNTVTTTGAVSYPILNWYYPPEKPPFAFVGANPYPPNRPLAPAAMAVEEPV